MKPAHSTAQICNCHAGCVQTHHSQCLAQQGEFHEFDCSIFESEKPTTLALSVLVLIEMCNALNR